MTPTNAGGGSPAKSVFLSAGHSTTDPGAIAIKERAEAKAKIHSFQPFQRGEVP